jgi:tetratricopeptide (TPR) repeat protein
LRVPRVARCTEKLLHYIARVTSKLLTLIASAALLLPVLAPGQQPHPALQGEIAFLTEIANKEWECSFTAYPRVRFFADKIEVLSSDGKVTSTLNNVTHPEPGIVRVGFNSGVVLFVFSDDLQSFVIANMKDMSEFTVNGAVGAVKVPAAATDKPLEIAFKDHPYWKTARLHHDRMELLEANGAVFATNAGFAFTPQTLGVQLPEKGAGLVALSRKGNGGWYLGGMHLGTGVRTERSGYFRFFVPSKLTGFAARSAHFTYALLLAGLNDLAIAQERYGIQFVKDTYGETSDTVTRAFNEIGKLRRYARSYKASPPWHLQALEHAKANQASDKNLLLEIGIDLAEAQNDAGEFAAAKAALAEAYPLLPPAGSDTKNHTAFQYALGTTEFGLRNYAQAERIFAESAAREKEGKREGSHIAALLRLLACQLAQGQNAKAEATLKVITESQDLYTKQNPKYNFDTWEIAFACIALGRHGDAIRYAPTANRRGWIAYEEYGRLLALLQKDGRDAGQQFARTLSGRFRDLDEVRIRNDVDAITVKLTQAIAELTPEAISALEKEWAEQVESLRNRPLKNYIFARVMVATLAKLKSGK